jgi:hypothetical protein
VENFSPKLLIILKKESRCQEFANLQVKDQ